MWTKERIIQLNKLICEESGQPHAIRDEGILDTGVYLTDRVGDKQYVVKFRPEIISERHPFVEGNKRTAVCISVCETLKNI